MRCSLAIVRTCGGERFVCALLLLLLPLLLRKILGHETCAVRWRCEYGVVIVKMNTLFVNLLAGRKQC